MEKESSKSYLDTIKFLIRHPLIFFSVTILMSSIMTAIVMHVQVKYATRAIIAFETSGGGLIDTKFIQTKQDLLNNLLLGDNVRSIIKEIWPRIKEERDPNKFNYLKDLLRDPKYGLKIITEKDRQRKELKEQELITLQFISTEPKLCYRVVDAAIAVLKRMSKESTEEKIESGLNFLKKQLDFYRDKINRVDQEMAQIKAELKQKYFELPEEERELIDDIFNTANLREAGAKSEAKAEQGVKYEERLTELKLLMLELNRKREILKNSLGKGSLDLYALSDKDVEEDELVREFTRAIIMKELQKTEFISKGFLPAHPQVLGLEAEIERLKSLKEQRIEELTNPRMSQEAIKASDEKIKRELKILDPKIESLKIKIAALETYRKSTDQGLLPKTVLGSNISVQTAKLVDLRNERDISQKYYNDIRVQYENAELKSRLEKEEVGIEIKIIEEPKVPLWPLTQNNSKKVFMAIIMSIVAGAGAAYFVDTLDASIKASSELRTLLQIPVLGAIDRMTTIRDINARKARNKAVVISVVILGITLNVLIKLFMQLTSKL